jgi:two-component system response regulator YesN
MASAMSLTEFRHAYLANNNWFSTKYFQGVGKIYDLPMNNPQQKWEKVEQCVDENKILIAISNKDKVSLNEYIKNIFSELVLLKNYDTLFDSTRSLYEILKQSINILPNYIDKPDIGAENNYVHWYDAISLKEWFRDKFSELIEAIKYVQENTYSKTTLKVMDIIGANYHKSDLSLGFIAESVYLSVGHLCTLFKKETGMTIIDYLTDVRVAEAKKMLDGGSLKVYEVGTSVGYKSSQYFSQIFCNRLGLTPSEYLKNRY